jgi:hypothetical protein
VILTTKFSLRVRLTDSHSLPEAGGQPYCLSIRFEHSLCNRSLNLSFIRRSETFHTFLDIATWFYNSSVGWRQYLYKTMAYTYMSRIDLICGAHSAENDISGVHRQSLINQKRFVIRKPTCRILTGSHGKAIKWRRHFRRERPLAPEMVFQPFPLNLNREQIANNKT